MLVCSISCMTVSVCATCSWISEDSFLIFSNVAMTLTSSRMEPCTLESACRRLSSNSRIFTLNSPWSFSMSARFLSTSGRSDFNSAFMHWLWSEDGVTVKFTKVTLLHKSGVNCAVESRVHMYISKDGLKSMSWSPKEIKTRGPCLNVSLLSTLLRMGSTLSTSMTSKGAPNLSEVSKCFMTLGSTNDVFINLLPLNSFVRYVTAWPEGSMIMG
mmetsp:Transcript_48059/g.103035  ORF Transcript_48059/g.103035 Transcript_48059/m.103035 type:complete len:214 (-) Transcript_48059:575-1216(-)